MRPKCIPIRQQESATSLLEEAKVFGSGVFGRDDSLLQSSRIPLADSLNLTFFPVSQTSLSLGRPR
jgi:hypothetical protein